MGALRVYRSLEEVPGDFGPCALTIGNFDGVHAAHRRILRRVVAVARANVWRPSALTFEPHPATVVAPERAPKLLTSPIERAGLMQSEGIEQVLILPFTEAVAHLSPREFVENILVKRLGVRAVLVGENFRFGRNQAGNVATLKELGRKCGFQTETISAIALRGRMVSSSAIRRLIEQGAVSAAARLLERWYALEGAVIPGRGVGSAQTVPTLNLGLEAEVLPAVGVYVTRAWDAEEGRSWPSVTNVGYRPTFGGDSLSVETFLLSALNGRPPRRIRVEFLFRLRDERKFPSAEDLKAQILRDARWARAYHGRLRRWCEAPAEATVGTGSRAPWALK